jgi:hypothetical protein
MSGMSTILQGFIVLFLLSMIPLGWVALRTYRRFRGTRVITCPETGRAAAVEIDKRHAAATFAMGEQELRLTSCSRWPEKEGCGQDCLSQIEASPEGCLARSMLVEWYRDTTCVYCREEIPEIRWSDNKPALLTPDGKTIGWAEVRPEDLPTVFATHQRVCWNCHIAQSFRAQFPDRAVERPSAKRAS